MLVEMIEHPLDRNAIAKLQLQKSKHALAQASSGNIEQHILQIHEEPLSDGRLLLTVATRRSSEEEMYLCYNAEGTECAVLLLD